jgi:hypothetical protein
MKVLVSAHRNNAIITLEASEDGDVLKATAVYQDDHGVTHSSSKQMTLSSLPPDLRDVPTLEAHAGIVAAAMASLFAGQRPTATDSGVALAVAFELVRSDAPTHEVVN